MPPDPLVAAFDRLVARRPHDILVLSARRRATVAEVDSLARALADRLAGPGVGEAAPVALVAANGPGFLACWLALRRRRAVPVLVDGATPPRERRRLAAELGVDFLLELGAEWPGGASDAVLTAVERGATARLELPDDAASVKLTSGSTGVARGIAVSAEALLADDEQLTASMGLRPEDRRVAAVPLSHSYGLSSLAVPALARGATLVLPADSGPLAPWTAARECQATFLPTVPAWLGALVRLSVIPPPPPALRLVVSAGAPLPPQTASRFRELCGQPVHVFYGASECGGIAYDREGGAGERGTVGTPVEGVRIELDPEDGRIRVASAAVALGVVPQPDPRVGGGRFETADLGTWLGGELRLLGRADDLLIVRGKNVNPREIEAALRELQGVDDVAVFAPPAEPGGEPLLRAVIACREGALDYARVAAFCRARLADHKVPRSLVFVPELPRTDRGKLDRRALLALR
jgi:acyl-CoA synthetase (AMP-forming)/AMP-acid ligase II